jgi:hypothetical protein
VAAHQHWAGTHAGEFNGVPTTSRSFTFVSTAILRIRDGMIAEAIDVVGMAELMAQLTRAPLIARTGAAEKIQIFPNQPAQHSRNCKEGN